MFQGTMLTTETSIKQNAEGLSHRNCNCSFIIFNPCKLSIIQSFLSPATSPGTFDPMSLFSLQLHCWRHLIKGVLCLLHSFELGCWRHFTRRVKEYIVFTCCNSQQILIQYYVRRETTRTGNQKYVSRYIKLLAPLAIQIRKEKQTTLMVHIIKHHPQQ